MKRLIISLILTIGLLMPVLAGFRVYAADDASKKAACEAIAGKDAYDAATGKCNSGPESKTSPQSLVETVITLFSWVVGAVSVIMIIYGGFRYITSGGDSGKVTSAKNTIIYALIGLVIVAASQLLVNFVLNKTNCATNPSAAGCTQQKK